MTLYNPSFTNSFRTGGEPDDRFQVRSDSAIEEEIWDRLSKENSRVFSAEHLAVEVRHGQVKLSGHVGEESQRQLAKQIAAQVTGVTHVWNEIVQDHDLRARVIRALSKDERTAAFLIPVKCTNGWISLGGIVPTTEAAQAAELVAGSVPDVRGILSIPWVVGLPWTNPGQVEPDRRAFQPGAGAVVHESLNDDLPGSSGVVVQVILDPHSRLLTHVVVQAREKREGGQLSNTHTPLRGRVIPVSAIEAANRDNVWLKAGEAICLYPAFQTYCYPGVPQDWRPPFPYKPEIVRWSGR